MNQKNYVNTLNGGLLHGFSGKDFVVLSKWLNDYGENDWNLAVDIDHQVGKNADFSRIDLGNNKVCCVLRMNIARECGHYITALYEESGYIYCYNPYFEEEKETRNWQLTKMKSGCNLKVKFQ